MLVDDQFIGRDQALIVRGKQMLQRFPFEGNRAAHAAGEFPVPGPPMPLRDVAGR